jgi:hypothetical protein
MTENNTYPEVYIAGPLFNPEENLHNDTLTKMFRDQGYTVFNPIRDGIQQKDLVDLTVKEKEDKYHQTDYAKATKCKIFVGNMNGPQVDDGTASESGMAYTHRRCLKEFLNCPDELVTPQLIIGYLSDTRCITQNFRRNPLVSGNYDIVFDNRQDIINYALNHCPPQSKSYNN